ncbi:hypothetical protein OBBRIDRAFT_836694 [Obba rivulosa]|uniref:Uncharacterized protein n=1 Tax=Obba rivulosa TaxID=1052685 RepID=A0A8E2DJY2_9APHY|nr:hypothetical protein OBBRIDRAFT_836694 [Obba rivulosa]
MVVPQQRRGVEWVHLPSGASYEPLNHTEINDLIFRTTLRLAQAGKRLLRAPYQLPDGLIFDWVLDNSARNEGPETLLKVEGVDPGSLRIVLRRREPIKALVLPQSPTLVSRYSERV